MCKKLTVLGVLPVVALVVALVVLVVVSVVLTGVELKLSRIVVSLKMALTYSSPSNLSYNLCVVYK